MTNQNLINELHELEAIGQLMRDRAEKFVKDCRRTRQKMEGVSTPSARKGRKPALDAKQVAALIARKNRKIKAV